MLNVDLTVTYLANIMVYCSAFNCDLNQSVSFSPFLHFKIQDPGMMSTRKRCDLFSLCFYANVILLFYFASAYTDPLDVKSLEDLYGLLNQPTMLTGWMATGGDPCGQNWTGVSCSGSSIMSMDMSYNNFFGEVPSGLPPNATFMNLAANKIAGNIPMSLPSLKNLKYLNVSNNNLFAVVDNALRCIAMTLAVYLHIRLSSRRVGSLAAFIVALFLLPILQVVAVNEVKDDSPNGKTLLAVILGLVGLLGTAAGIMAIPLPDKSTGWIKKAGGISMCVLDVIMLLFLIATIIWGLWIHYHRARVGMKIILHSFLLFFLSLAICTLLKVLVVALSDFKSA